jgi:hypothetical protein
MQRNWNQRREDWHLEDRAVAVLRHPTVQSWFTNTSSTAIFVNTDSSGRVGSVATAKTLKFLLERGKWFLERNTFIVPGVNPAAAYYNSGQRHSQ